MIRMGRCAAASGLLAGLLAVSSLAGQERPIKIGDCPPAVRKTLESEARGAKFEHVDRIDDDGAVVYGAGFSLHGRKYQIRVDAQGMLLEVGLEVGDGEVRFAECPPAVQATFRREATGAKFDLVERDIRYGVPVYEALVALGGKDYSVVVAENGTLVEKVLIVAEDEVELTHCPSAVQSALKEQAQGGKLGPITRATGIGGYVYEVEIEAKGRTYFLELTEGGGLISKSLAPGEPDPAAKP